MKHGYFLEEDVTLWDAPFFGITAKEAAGMDPMKRLLLEVSYECFENGKKPFEDLPISLNADRRSNLFVENSWHPN